ncbi:MAG: glycosyltransferase [Ignavibacteriales bacterium]|nr:glycosyltransferase [Ignavibacteriales bacterium]
MKTANKIFVINRSIKEKIMQYFTFVQHTDVSIVTHGFDPEDFENAVPHPKAHNRMILTHSGLFYEYVTPYYLLHAFKKLLTERPDIGNDIELMFVGLLRKSLTRLVKKLGLEAHVNITGYVSHTEAISKILMSDVLWVMVGKARNSDANTPSKFFEYVGTRKPVFGMVVDGAMKHMIEEYKAGYICDPYKIEEIKETLIKMHADYIHKRFPKADDEVVEKYRRDNLTDQLAKEFQFIARVK